MTARLLPSPGCSTGPWLRTTPGCPCNLQYEQQSCFHIGLFSYWSSVEGSYSCLWCQPQRQSRTTRVSIIAQNRICSLLLGSIQRNGAIPSGVTDPLC
jgi:hypothetical protein